MGIFSKRKDATFLYEMGVRMVNEENVDHVKKGLDYLKEAAGCGHGAAALKIGDVYAAGGIVPQNYNEARQWYEKAAADGQEEARKRIAALAGHCTDVDEHTQRPLKAPKWRNEVSESNRKPESHRALPGSIPNPDARGSTAVKRIACGWIFRVCALITASVSWGIFLCSYGSGVPLVLASIGVVVSGTSIAVDLIFARRSFHATFWGFAILFLIYIGAVPSCLAAAIVPDGVVQLYGACCAISLFCAMFAIGASFDEKVDWRKGLMASCFAGVLAGWSTSPNSLIFMLDKVKPEAQVCALALAAGIMVMLAVASRSGNRYLVSLVMVVMLAAVGVSWLFFAGWFVADSDRYAVACRSIQRGSDPRSFTVGMHILDEVCRSEYPPALLLNAKMLLSGVGPVRKDATRGYEFAVKAGDCGVAEAFELQGTCLETGNGVQQNLAAAMKCYQMAVQRGCAESEKNCKRIARVAACWEGAARGEPEAILELARCYKEGDGIPIDQPQARSLVRNLVAKGIAAAQDLYGDWLIAGIGGNMDTKLGVDMYEKAASQGCVPAIFKLGRYYFDGKIIQKDLRKALKFFSLASDKGDARASYMCGCCYLEGLGCETNVVKAFESFKLADERGWLPASCLLGSMYESGTGTSVDYTAAVEAYSRSATKEWSDDELGIKRKDALDAKALLSQIGLYWRPAQNNVASAQYQVGKCYSAGNGVERNAKLAYEWYCKSADQNYSEGIVAKADSLYNGIGVGTNRQEAVRLYAQAHSNGNCVAAFKLGIAYERGEGVMRNLANAYDLYKIAERHGIAGAGEHARRISIPAKVWNAALIDHDPKALYELAECYDLGSIGVEKDLDRAFRLYKASASLGYTEALYKVAVCYRDGRGVDKDEKLMVKYFEAAANKRHGLANYVLGNMYKLGLSVPQNLTKAYWYFMRASEVGCALGVSAAEEINKVAGCWELAEAGKAEAQYELGCCYRDGVQIIRDDEKAKKWFRAAAKQGHHEAAFALAAMLHARNCWDDEIVKLLESSSAAGCRDAMVLLGRMLYSGNGIAENYERALKLWKMAADSGSLDAKYCLGEHYYKGKGYHKKGQDEERALAMWKEAANAGHAESAYRLGCLYVDSRMSVNSIVTGLNLLRKAASAGNVKAMKRLIAHLRESNDKTRIAEAEEWESKLPQLGVRNGNRRKEE